MHQATYPKIELPFPFIFSERKHKMTLTFLFNMLFFFFTISHTWKMPKSEGSEEMCQAKQVKSQCGCPPLRVSILRQWLRELGFMSCAYLTFHLALTPWERHQVWGPHPAPIAWAWLPASPCTELKAENVTNFKRWKEKISCSISVWSFLFLPLFQYYFEQRQAETTSEKTAEEARTCSWSTRKTSSTVSVKIFTQGLSFYNWLISLMSLRFIPV